MDQPSAPAQPQPKVRRENASLASLNAEAGPSTSTSSAAKKVRRENASLASLNAEAGPSTSTSSAASSARKRPRVPEGEDESDPSASDPHGHVTATTENIPTRKVIVLSEAKGDRKGKGKAPAHQNSNQGEPDDREIKVVIRRPARLSTEEEKAARDSKNAERRAAFLRLARENPAAAIAQRQASGRARSDLVSDWWTDTVVDIGDGECALLLAASHLYPNKLEFLQAFVAAFMLQARHTPISPEDPVWKEFPPRTLSLLVAIARNPTEWDVEEYLNDGTIAVSEPDDAAPDSAVANYVRRIKVGIDAIRTFKQYLCSHPADAPHTILQLIMLGEPLADIRVCFREAMVEFGLETAVDVLFERISGNAGLLALAGNRKQSPKTSVPYAGMTYAVACGKRGWDDLDGDADVRIVNYLQSQADPAFTTYHLTEIDSPIDNPLDIRTSPTIGNKERILRAVMGSAAMNSAPGGVLPVFLPSQHLLDLKDRVRELSPSIQFPLGLDRDFHLEMRLRELIDDEVGTFGPLLSTPTASALEALKQCAADVIRTREGKLVKMELTKDIPHEQFNGKCGGYWADNSGEGPHEHRHLLRLLHPEIPATGDLTLDVIAQHIGPTIDFWRLVLLHVLYYLLHVLYMSRVFHLLRPLIVVTQSNPMAAMMRSGDLSTVWSHLSAAEVSSTLDAKTPEGLATRLPKKSYPRLNDFTSVIGTLNIVQTGPDPSCVSLHIPHPHYGRLKYDPILARYRWDVDFLVELGIETTVQTTAAALQESGTVDWGKAPEVCGFLERVKARSRATLEQAGVTQALATAKNSARRAELAVALLRAMRPSKLRHERFLAEGGKAQGRREGILAKGDPWSDERETQLEEILKQARMLDYFDLPDDPEHLGSWKHQLLGDTWPDWFRSLEKGKDVLYAANALGRTQAGAVGAEANQQRFAEWHKTHKVEVYVDTVAIGHKNTRDGVTEMAMDGPYTVNELLRSWRVARCGDCHALVVGHHNAAYHLCLDNSIRQLTAEQFPDIERVLYAHDILGNLKMDESEDLAAELRLVAVPVEQILQCDSALERLQQVLRPEDVEALRPFFASTGQIYVPEDRLDDHALQLRLAVDIILSTHSTCPEFFLPTNPDCRLAWTRKQGTTLVEWFENRASPLVLIVCEGPSSYTGPPYFICTESAKRKGDGWILKGRLCPPCDHKGSEGRKYHEVKTLLDLPPHHSRFLWFQLHRSIVWPPQRASKKPKSRR